MSRRLRVAVLGLGHQGTVAAACWPKLGHEVRAWDPDPEAQQRVLKTEAEEPYMGDFLAEALTGGSLKVCQCASARHVLGWADVVHVAFDAKTDTTGRVADSRPFDAIQDASAWAKYDRLVVVSSQMPVGTCAKMRRMLRADLELACLPENLRVGRAVVDFLTPSRTVIGADTDLARRLVEDLLVDLPGERLTMSLASAELSKHATNAYLAACVTFANSIAAVAREVGADANDALAAVLADSRCSPSAPLRPGLPFSGPTLRRDLIALIDRDPDSAFFVGVSAANSAHKLFVEDTLLKEFGRVRLSVGVIGLSYKPGTASTQGSAALEIAERLTMRHRVRAWDPWAEPLAELSRVERVATLMDLGAERLDALVLLHPFILTAAQLSQLSPRGVVDAAGSPRVDAGIPWVSVSG